MKTSLFSPRKYGELQKVADRVYIFRNITNSSFVIGDDACAVIDTQVNAPLAKELLKALRSVTDKPIAYAINTHYHWDHTNGNQLFKNEGACVVSSALTKEFMQIREPRQKEFLAGRGFELGKDPLRPERTFEGDMMLDLGNQPLRLFFAGRAETDDATAVHVMKENVLMSGDTVMTGSFPIFGQPVWDEGLQGDDWIKTIQNLMALKPLHVIPGHGPLAHDAEIEKLIRIERFFLEEVSLLVKKGLDADSVLRDLEPRLPEWITEIPVVWGTPRYAILRVFRGLTKKKDESNTGWQFMKPSAIPRAGEDFSKMAREAKEGGDLGLQLDILKKASEVSPNSADALTAYANALIEASRREPSVLEKGDFFEAAKAAWDEALRLFPNHAGALLAKGRYFVMMAYRGGDDPAQGMKLLESVIDMKPGGSTQAEAEFYLGIGFRRLGNEPRAKAQFEKALKLDPAFAPARLASGK